MQQICPLRKTSWPAAHFHRVITIFQLRVLMWRLRSRPLFHYSELKGKPAWPSEASNNLNTCRLPLYLSLFLSLSLSPFSQAYNPAISSPGNSPGCGSATWTALPGQDEGAWRVHRTGMAQHLEFTRSWCWHKWMKVVAEFVLNCGRSCCHICRFPWYFFAHLEHERINISQRQ